jgi:hypothetical protein
MEPKNKQFRGLSRLQKSILKVMPREKANQGLDTRKKGDKIAFERNMAEYDTFENANKNVKDLDKAYKALPESDKEHGVAVARGGAVRRVKGGNLPSITTKEDLDKKK